MTNPLCETMITNDISERSKEKFKQVKVGKKIYRQLYENYLSDPNDYPLVVVFPHDDEECNYYGLLFLDELLVRNLQKSALILTDCDLVEKTAELFTKKIKAVVKLTPDEIDSLTSLYCFKPFDNIIFVSLSKPEGRTAFRIVGANGLTKKMLVAIGVYFLIPYPDKTPLPLYEGNDENIIKFLERVE